MKKLPDWDAKPDDMEKWVIEQLNALPYGDEGGPASEVEFTWMNDDDARRIAAAEHGDIEPLREKYPHLAPYLFTPKRKRGARFFRPDDPWWRDDNPFLAYGRAITVSPVQCAVDDVRRIRALWRKAYSRFKRASSLISAEEIAANRWGVNVEEIFAAQKKHKK
jgi:hypothetical protein